MNWFVQNRFLGSFLVALGLCALLSLGFLFYEKGRTENAQTRLENTITESNRLRSSSPFPNVENLKKTKAQTDAYRSSILALENELKARMLPGLPLQPNEFQAQLRLAVTAVQQRASANKVQLPANFSLGFDEYATSLPNSEAAPQLGRQLRAIEWIANAIIDAHADSLTSLNRSQLPEEKDGAIPLPNPRARTGGSTKRTVEKIVESTSINVAFAGSPAAARRILNQVGAAKDQFYVLRTLVVKNQVDKGPRRGGAEPAARAPQPAPSATRSKAKEPGIDFIVGTEHLDVVAKIEIVKFAIPNSSIR